MGHPGIPSILDTILRDAGLYSIIVFACKGCVLLFFFFFFFAPAGDNDREMVIIYVDHITVYFQEEIKLIPGICVDFLPSVKTSIL